MLADMTPRPHIHRVGRLAFVALLTGLVLAVATGTSAATPSTTAQRANLAPTKAYLLSHTTKLRGFTTRFRSQANRYYALARAANFDYATLWSTKRAAVAPILARSKALWIEATPTTSASRAWSRERRRSPSTT